MASFLALTLCNVLAAAAIPRHRQDPDTYPIIIQCLGQSTFLGSPTSRTVHRSPKTNRTTAHEHRLAHSPSHGRSGTLPSEVPQAVSRPSHSHTTNIPTGYHLVTTGSGHPRGETPLHLSYTHRNSDFRSRFTPAGTPVGGGVTHSRSIASLTEHKPQIATR